jgi:two-component system, LuxR family, response regulator FixJ
MSSLREGEAIVFIVDEDEAVRDSICLLLDLHDIDAIAFPSLEEFLDRVRHDRAMCAFVDLSTTRMKAADLLRMLDKREFLASVTFMSDVDRH